MVNWRSPTPRTIGSCSFRRTDASMNQQPVAALGQPTLAANGENRWEAVGADTLCWPYGVHWHRGELELLAIADSGNNRVVLWERS